MYPDCCFANGMSNHNKPIFDFQNEVFISANESIDLFYLANFLKFHMRRENVLLRKRTKFCLISGIHHDDQSNPTKNDEGLNVQFLDGTFEKKLKKYCGDPNCDNCKNPFFSEQCSSGSIWNDYQFQVQLYSISVEDGKENLRELTEEAKARLIKLTKELFDAEQPHVVIFASCFSFMSQIRNYMIANGVMSVLNIIKDRGDLSGGRLFMLDQQQQKIISAFGKTVRNFWMQSLCAA